jgi:hypothetical protein
MLKNKLRLEKNVIIEKNVKVTKKVGLKRKVSVTDSLLEMKVGDELYFSAADASESYVRATASRLKGKGLGSFTVTKVKGKKGIFTIERLN